MKIGKIKHLSPIKKKKPGPYGKGVYYSSSCSILARQFNWILQCWLLNHVVRSSTSILIESLQGNLLLCFQNWICGPGDCIYAYDGIEPVIWLQPGIIPFSYYCVVSIAAYSDSSISDPCRTERVPQTAGGTREGEDHHPRTSGVNLRKGTNGRGQIGTNTSVEGKGKLDSSSRICRFPNKSGSGTTGQLHPSAPVRGGRHVGPSDAIKSCSIVTHVYTWSNIVHWSDMHHLAIINQFCIYYR